MRWLRGSGRFDPAAGQVWRSIRANSLGSDRSRAHGRSVRRPHGAPRARIFDTAAIEAGKIYDLEAHLDRFIRSARTSKIQLPGERRCETSSCGPRRRAGGERARSATGPLWGRKSRSHAGRRRRARFFVMIFAGLAYPDTWYTQGLRVMTTTYPIKPPLYAVTRAPTTCPTPSCRWRRRSAARQRSSSTRLATWRELQHERGLRGRGRMLKHRSSTTSCPGAPRCACWSWPPRCSHGTSSREWRCATSPWPRPARRGR